MMSASSSESFMTVTRADGRRAGVLYLVLLVLAPLNLLYIPRMFIVPSDAAATAQNISAGLFTYRIGILVGMADNVVFLLLALSLYNLFRYVDARLCRMMLALVIVCVGINLANLLVQTAPLVLLNGSDMWSAFTKPQLDAFALGSLRLRASGVQVASAFFGLWLFPFGLLVIRSGFLPRILGVLLIVGGIAYLIVSMTSIALPEYRRVVDSIMMPFYAIGELSIIVWLLVKGIDERALTPRSGVGVI